MPLPTSGSISMSQVLTELSLSGAISLGQAEVRNLAGVASGAISMSNLHGKSAATHTHVLTVGAWAINGVGSRGFDLLQPENGGNLIGTPLMDAVSSSTSNVNSLYVRTSSQRASARVSFPGLGAVTVPLVYDSKLNWSSGSATLSGIYNFLDARAGQNIPVDIT